MTKKRIRTIVIVVLILAVLAAAVWLIARQVRSQTVNVYAVSDVAEGWYGGDDSLEGTVTEGNAEVIPLDEGMVASFAVQAGDEVKKGDLLLTYDTSTYQLTLSSDQANIAMLQSQITQAQQDIRNYRNMTTAEQVTPAPTPTPKAAPTTLALISGNTKPSGSVGSEAYYNCAMSTVVQSVVLLNLRDSGDTVSFRIYDGRDLVGVWTVDGAALQTEYSDVWTPENWTLGSGIDLTGDGTVTVDFSKPHYGSFESVIPEEADDGWYEPDNSGYYTAAEIAEMIREKNADIASYQRELKQAQLKYQRDQLTSRNGEVRAKSDGTVTKVADPHNISVGEPLITIQGSTRPTIQVYVDELSLDVLQPGDTVSVYAYESGNAFTATVRTLGDKPTDNYSYYGSNRSYYPVTCEANEDVELRAWEWCEVTLDSYDDSSSALYLPMYFIREDGGGSYVLAQGENGRLEQRYVSTGAILWGSSVEIRGGLTYDDYVAFPYGRGVQAGNPTKISGLDELYNYY